LLSGKSLESKSYRRDRDGARTGLRRAGCNFPFRDVNDLTTPPRDRR
jgi:hypothetical protein